MKVLLLNTFDTLGGAARAAGRLQEGLQAQGVDAKMLVQFKFGESADVLCHAGPLVKKLSQLKTYLGTLPVKIYPSCPENNFSPSLLPDNILKQVSLIDPDIIHLHWLCAGFLQIETLRKLAELGKPIVWTLHDSWAFTGGCHVPFDCTRYRERCGACPVLGSSRERDLSRWTWNRKERTWRGLNLNLVTPSRWLTECAGSSPLFQNSKIRTIPNGLDPQVFSPFDRQQSRKQLGLPEDRQIILFGAMKGTSDPNKGFQLLTPILRNLGQHQANLQALVFGSNETNETTDLGMPTEYLGPLRNDESLAKLYSATDVFVVPSLQEAFCQTATEAMACGIPVVAFGSTGLLDIVEHKKSGYLAEPYQIEDFARGIKWILSDRERYVMLSEQARRRAVGCFDISKIAKEYADLYRKVLPSP